MSKTKNKKAATVDAASDVSFEYMIKSVSELDLMVQKYLVRVGAAEKPSAGSSQYKILDREKAKSTVVMPKVLNPLGKKGWRLVSVNKMECYIFEKHAPVEYSVLTPAEIDKRSIRLLQQKGSLTLAGFEGETPKLELSDPSNARIQDILPEILADYGKEGWQLAAISGPQLYYFTRNL